MTLHILLAGLIIIGYQACGPQHDSYSSESASGSVEVTAFQTTLKVYFDTQGCADCHGTFQQPLFAVVNPAAGLLAVSGNAQSGVLAGVPLINETTPANSALYQKVLAGHNGGNAPMMLQAINDYIALLLVP